VSRYTAYADYATRRNRLTFNKCIEKRKILFFFFLSLNNMSYRRIQRRVLFKKKRKNPPKRFTVISEKKISLPQTRTIVVDFEKEISSDSRRNWT
jgi:hypothetical protein